MCQLFEHHYCLLSKYILRSFSLIQQAMNWCWIYIPDTQIDIVLVFHDSLWSITDDWIHTIAEQAATSAHSP